MGWRTVRIEAVSNTRPERITSVVSENNVTSEYNYVHGFRKLNSLPTLFCIGDEVVVVFLIFYDYLWIDSRHRFYESFLLSK